MLKVSGLDAFYGASHVLHGVDLDVEGGELVGLLGRNGAGKTTTLSALAGTVTTRNGKIELDGEDLTGLASHERVRRGLVLVPSGARVFGNLTVEENLQIVRPRPLSNGKAWSIDRVYELFGKLRDLQSNLAGGLSGGERQMLAVGRGLMANPKVLLLDEPSEGLAPVVVAAIGKLVDELKASGLAVVLAEQNYRFALRHADRALLIAKGAIQYRGAAAELEGSDALRDHLGV